MDCTACGHTNRPSARFCEACGTQLASSEGGARQVGGAQPLQPPLRLPESVANGRYDVIRFLGEGRRKRVYLAFDQRLEREVAIARIKPQGLDETGRARAWREAQAMARLSGHRNTVTVYDSGEDDEGGLYLISEYLAGGDLQDLIARQEEPLSIERVLRIAADVARALSHAHANNILHRDVKPSNVWLTEDGAAKLGDFGLAVAVEQARLTVEGMMVGTVAYMSPEQAIGRPVDERSDLYSLGALTYELLCGRQPFVGDDPVAIVSQHLNTPPLAPSWQRHDIAPALEDLVLALLQKSPQQRPSDAGEVLSALRAVDPHQAPRGPRAPTRRNERLVRSAFVGRGEQVALLQEAFDQTLLGAGRLIMVAGEAGIGKTRLATEVAAYAGLRGAAVLHGTCHEGGSAPPYWPWIEVIRSYVSRCDASELRSLIGTGASDIAQIVSEVRERLGGVSERPALEPEQARFRLFDSVCTFLRNAAGRRPLAILLDDLHAADKPSLLLLQFLVRELRDARIFILGTYRDREVDRRHPLWDVLAAARREGTYDRVRLHGFTEADVRAMLERIAQHELDQPTDAELVRTVWRETDGNPYFVEEVVRHLLETGVISRREGRWAIDPAGVRMPGIPEGVRDLVRRRLTRLPEECVSALTVASVIGREFEVEVLERVSNASADELLDRLEEAEAAGLAEELPEAVGRYRFASAIIHETLYGELPSSRRRALHGRVAEVLEARGDAELEPLLSELARHFLESGRREGIERAVQYATRAAQRAVRQLAYEEAAAQYERALQALDTLKADGSRTGEMLLALGDARWRSGQSAEAREAYLRASFLARNLGDAEQFALAALGYGTGLGGFAIADRADRQLLALLREALTLLPDRDCTLRVRVMARLAVELYHTDANSERGGLARAAVEMAERLDDPAVQLIALYSLHWSTLGPDGLEEQLAAAERIIALARSVGDEEMEFRGHHFRLNSLLQRGDVRGADAEIAECDRIAAELRQPLYQWQSLMLSGMRAMLDGRLEEGERLAGEAAAVGQRGQPEMAVAVLGAQTFIGHWALGTLDELVDMADTFVAKYPYSTWPAAVAFAYAELDRRADARAAFERVAADGFSSLRRDGNFLATGAILAVPCAYLGDRLRAAQLYELMRPYADRFPTLLAGAGTTWSNESPLGMLAATLGRFDDAAVHFERALARSALTGVPWRVLAQREYARLLIARDDMAHREAAAALIDEALETAREHGMARAVEQLLALKLDAHGLLEIDQRTSVESVAAAVNDTRPDLVPVAAPDGTLTIMFSDVQDSAAMVETLGDRRWLEILRAHNTIVRREVIKHGGFEVKAQGDGFMVAFSSPQRAVECAIAVQRAFASARAEGLTGEPLHVRIGLHAGEVIRDRDDFFGITVVLAARIAAHARADEVLVSAALRRLVADERDGVIFDAGRALELKGLTGEHRVYAATWQELPSAVADERAGRISR